MFNSLRFQINLRFLFLFLATILERDNGVMLFQFLLLRHLSLTGVSFLFQEDRLVAESFSLCLPQGNFLDTI